MGILASLMNKWLMSEQVIQQIKEDEELDPRWGMYVSEYLRTGKSFDSAIIAGFSESYAMVIKSRFPDKVKKSLVEALETKGITSEKIAEKIRKLIEDNDPSAIDKGLNHAIKIRGDYAPDKSLNVNVNVETVNDEAISKLADLLNQQAKDAVQQGTDIGIDGEGSNPLGNKT
jgi:phage terminase small subunit